MGHGARHGILLKDGQQQRINPIYSSNKYDLFTEISMANKPGFLERTWHFLIQPSAKYSVLAISTVSLIAGIILWGGFNTSMEATNEMEFCISCHEMRDNVFMEY
jgi:hypothetical protein